MDTRRTFLVGLPTLAALTPLAAAAFRLEVPSAAVAADYGAACPAATTHDALRTELEALFEGRPLPPALEPRLAALTRCPFCGCGVAGAADHGEQEG